MSIERHRTYSGTYYIGVCNNCGSETSEAETREKAREAMREDGWKHSRNDGEWQDICPDCQGDESFSGGMRTCFTR